MKVMVSKRTVSKRTVSKRTVSKRTVSKRTVNDFYNYNSVILFMKKAFKMNYVLITTIQ